MRGTNAAIVVLATAAATAAAVAAPAVLLSRPEVTLGAQPAAGFSWADKQQAANVVRAWRMNGPYSECMAMRGYDVPWQSTIYLAPGLAQDPALVELREKLSITEGDEDPVWNTRGFLDSVHYCLDTTPERRGPGNPEDIEDWDAILAEARDHGWSPDDPFALD